MIPIYKGTADEAREKGELDLWQQSWRENMRCRKAIEASISRHFDGMHLDHDIHLPIIEKFGLESLVPVSMSEQPPLVDPETGEVVELWD